MYDYNSWTIVDWMKIGSDENRIGRKALNQNPLDEKYVYHLAHPLEMCVLALVNLSESFQLKCYKFESFNLLS